MASAWQGWQGKAIGLGLLLLGTSWTWSAEAEEKARLVYVRGAGADECPAEVDLRLLVMARLGYDPFSPQASRVVLSRIELSGQQLVGSLEVIDQGGMATGRRELTAQVGRCADLARALALSISLAIDPERASQPPRAPQAQPTPPSTDGTEPPPIAAKAKPKTPPEPRPPPAADAPKARAFLSLALAGSAGALPAPALGGAVSVGWRFGFGSVALEGLVAQGLSSELTPRGKLTGALFLGGASACWAAGAWAVCGLAVAGAQRLGTSGVAHPLASYGLFLGAGPRVAWVRPLGPRWQAFASLEGLVNLRRNGAELSGREVWRTPPASATLSLGLRTTFL